VTPQKDNLASTKRHTRSHPDPDQVLIYSDPENLVTWRNIREHQTSSYSCNPYLEISPSIIHQNVESIYLTDIPEYFLYSLKSTPEHLIDLQISPLEFIQEVSSSHRPFLKILVPPLSFKSHNIILQNLMDALGGGRPGGNKPPPPTPINP
jgi:hypothetical protein